jgi:chemotaxis protein methyltransferase CheR
MDREKPVKPDVDTGTCSSATPQIAGVFPDPDQGPDAMTLLSSSNFRTIAALAKERWGLDLTDKKQAMVSNRLEKFVRRSPFNDVRDYLRHLEENPSDDDLLVFFDILSTNTTSFFREIEHFHYLQRALYAPLSSGELTLPSRSLRIWSAACSNGAEPYSLVMHAMDCLGELERWDVRVLATDLSTRSLEVARNAVYPVTAVENLDRAMVRRYFLRGRGAREGMVRVKPGVREPVSIRRLNLMDSWPMRGPFDVILCRNVMIYFDQPTRQRLVERLCELLRPGGVLVVGSAETLSGLNVDLRVAQPSVYLK